MALNDRDMQVIHSLETLYNTKPLSQDQIQSFVVAVQKQFNISKLEVLQLINHRPSTILESYLCLQQAIDSERLQEEDLEKIISIVSDKLGAISS